MIVEKKYKVLIEKHNVNYEFIAHVEQLIRECKIENAGSRRNNIYLFKLAPNKNYPDKYLAIFRIELNCYKTRNVHNLFNDKMVTVNAGENLCSIEEALLMYLKQIFPELTDIHMIENITKIFKNIFQETIHTIVVW